MVAPFTLMCVKSVVSMMLTELDVGRALVPVQIVSIIPTTMAGKLPADVPTQVALPR